MIPLDINNSIRPEEGQIAEGPAGGRSKERIQIIHAKILQPPIRPKCGPTHSYPARPATTPQATTSSTTRTILSGIAPALKRESITVATSQLAIIEDRNLLVFRLGFLLRGRGFCSAAFTRDNNALPGPAVVSSFIRESTPDRSCVNSPACTRDPTSLLTTSFGRAIAPTTSFWVTPKPFWAMFNRKTTRPALPLIRDLPRTRSTLIASSANFLVALSIVAMWKLFLVSFSWDSIALFSVGISQL